MTDELTLERLEKPQSLDELAYDQIKAAIINCTVSPGDFLPEVRLADEMGISKTPIRKAMARLQQEGFLENIPYKGYFVADISAEDIREIYTLRELLECHVVRETTARFIPAEVDRLEALVDDADAALAAGDHPRFVQCNRQFHRMFSSKYGNARISDVLRNLEEHVRRIIMYVLQNGHDDLLDLQRDDHRRMFEAVRDGDVDGAATLMSAHLRDFSAALVARRMAGAAG